MNIGIDAKRIFFNSSGLGNYSRRFYNALALANPDDQFFLYTPKTVREDNPYYHDMMRDHGKIKYPSKKFHKIFGGSLWRTRMISGQLENDKINVYYGLSNEIPFGINKAMTRSIVIIHDLIFLRYPELYPAIDAYFYRKKTVYACRQADYIIAASEQTKRDIIRFYHIPAEKISVIYPGTDPAFYSEEVPDSAGFFNTARKYIISVGAITPRKNLLKTVQAFDLVKDHYDLDLVVVGTAQGLGRNYLKTVTGFIAQRGIADRVHFLGNVPYKYLPSLCRKAQLMVYPSQYEGFGMPIVEGFFSKIPVITSKGGCFPEAGGDGAVYINPDDVEEIAVWIERIMTSPALRDELILKGIKHVERFRQTNIENDIMHFHRGVKQSLQS